MSGFVMKADLEKTLQNIDKKFDQHKLLVTQRKWSAYLSTDLLNVTNNTWTKIPFDSLWFDCEGVGFSSNGYPVQEPGIYDVSLLTRWDTILDGMRYFNAIRLNAITEAYFCARASISTYYCSCFCSKKIPANIGDVIYGYVIHMDGTNGPDIQSARYATYMDIHLISRKCK